MLSSASDALKSATGNLTDVASTLKDAVANATAAAEAVKTASSSIAANGGADLDKVLTTKVNETKIDIGNDTTNMGFTYNYKQNGADWPTLKSKYPGVENKCGKIGSQSPVNLLQPIWSYGWAYGDTIPKSNDAHETTYNNLRKGV